MLKVKIYGIVNPVSDDVIYIGASRKPEVRHWSHCTGKKWEDATYRKKQINIMNDAGIKPELLILDEVDFPDVQFYEEFYIELMKTWGYNIEQYRSGYMINRLYLHEGQRVYVPVFGVFGTVHRHIIDTDCFVLIDVVNRVFNFSPHDLELI